jgi:hypothetical protein
MTNISDFRSKGALRFQELSQSPKIFEKFATAKIAYQAKLKEQSERLSSYLHLDDDNLWAIYTAYNFENHSFEIAGKTTLYIKRGINKLGYDRNGVAPEIKRDQFVERIRLVCKEILAPEATKEEMEETKAFIFWHAVGGKWETYETFIESGDTITGTEVDEKVSELLSPMTLKENLLLKKENLEKSLKAEIENIKEKEEAARNELKGKWPSKEMFKDIKEWLGTKKYVLEENANLKNNLEQCFAYLEKQDVACLDYRHSLTNSKLDNMGMSYEQRAILKKIADSFPAIYFGKYKIENLKEKITEVVDELKLLGVKDLKSQNPEENKISGVKWFFKMLATPFIKIAEFFKWLWNKIFG